MTIRVFEAFAGIGTQRMALNRLGIDHEVVGIAEIDKFAIKSYEAIHGETYNVGDISLVESSDIPDHDLFTYSFPCQDISVAGLQGGLDKDSGTRSSLLWECNRVIEHIRPKYLLMENVKNLVSKRHKHNFDLWLEHLSELGYTNYWEVLNAKDYGVPQNRERVFVVSILNDEQGYEFPDKMKLEIKLKDLLIDDVDEKFFLSEEQISKIVNSNYNQNKRRIQEKEYSDTLCARDYKDPKCVQVLQYDTETRKNSSRYRVYDDNGLSPSLTTMQGGGLQPMIPIKNATKQGYAEAHEYDSVDITYPNSKTRRGRVQKGVSHTITCDDNKCVVLKEKESSGRMGKQAVETFNENNCKHGDTINPFNKTVSSRNGVSPTLTTRPEGFKTAISVVTDDNFVPDSDDVSTDNYDLRIRKLTPHECWRLMGINDEDFYKAQEVNSNTQLYKQAGNAIVVDVMVYIFDKLFNVEE